MLTQNLLHSRNITTVTDPNTGETISETTSTNSTGVIKDVQDLFTNNEQVEPIPSEDVSDNKTTKTPEQMGITGELPESYVDEDGTLYKKNSDTDLYEEQPSNLETSQEQSDLEAMMETDEALDLEEGVLVADSGEIQSDAPLNYEEEPSIFDNDISIDLAEGFKIHIYKNPDDADFVTTAGAVTSQVGMYYTPEEWQDSDIERESLEVLYTTIADNLGEIAFQDNTQAFDNFGEDLSNSGATAFDHYIIGSAVNELGLSDSYGDLGGVLEAGLKGGFNAEISIVSEATTSNISFLDGAGASIELYIATQLAAEFQNIETKEEAIASKVFATAGYALFGPVGAFGGSVTGEYVAEIYNKYNGNLEGLVTDVFTGEFAKDGIDFVVSSISSVFGGKKSPPPPTGKAEYEYNEEEGAYELVNTESRNGGSGEAMQEIAEKITGSLNSVLGQIGGDVANPAEYPPIHVSHRKNTLSVNGKKYHLDSEGVADAANDFIKESAESLLIEGGDLTAKRAFYNSDGEDIIDDIQEAYRFNYYTNGVIVVDSEGNPVDSETYKRDIETLSKNELEDKYSAISSKEYVDGLIDKEQIEEYKQERAEIEAEYEQVVADLQAEKKSAKHDAWNKHGSNNSEDRNPQKHREKIEQIEDEYNEGIQNAQTTKENRLEELENSNQDTIEMIAWEKTLESASDLKLEEEHPTENITRFELYAEERGFPTSVDMEELTLELRGDILILSIEGRYLVIDDWSSWSKENQISLTDGNKMNLQDIIETYGVKDGEGAVDIAQAMYESVAEYVDEEDRESLSVGTSGDDTLTLNSDKSTVFAGEGDDTIEGSWRDDTISGGEGADEIQGGAGSDTATYIDSDEGVVASLEEGGGYTGDAAGDTYSEVENLTGSSHDDYLEGDSGDNVLNGLEGDDTLLGGAGDDTINGGLGDDKILGGEGNDRVSGGLGDDTIDGGSGDDTIFSGMGDDTVLGGYGNDTIYGRSGDDYIDGGEGNDTVNGGSGDDKILGGRGSDTIDGGSGNDYIDGGAGNDTIDSGTGDDTVLGGSGNDTIDSGRDNDYVDGGEGNDTINGGSGDDKILGGRGSDTIDGGLGDDTIDGGSGDDTIFSGTGDDTVLGGSGNDTIDSGRGNDYIDGGSGDDKVESGTGDDVVFGGSGNDTINSGRGNDYVDGGSGNDTLSFEGRSESVRVDLEEGVALSGEDRDTLNDIENVIGTDHNDYLAGDSGDNILDGAGGDDLFRADEGSDTIIGGEGEDSLDTSGSKEGVAVNLTGGVGGGGTVEGDTFSSIENVVGSSHDDQISGNDSDNKLFTGAGDDRVFGNNGNDTLNSGSGNNIVDGGTGNDAIHSGSGNDVIFGGSGDDRISAGKGTNLIFGESGNDTVSFKGSVGNYTISEDGAGIHVVAKNGSSRTIVRDVESFVFEGDGSSFSTKEIRERIQEPVVEEKKSVQEDDFVEEEVKMPEFAQEDIDFFEALSKRSSQQDNSSEKKSTTEQPEPTEEPRSVDTVHDYTKEDLELFEKLSLQVGEEESDYSYGEAKFNLDDAVANMTVSDEMVDDMDIDDEVGDDGEIRSKKEGKNRKVDDSGVSASNIAAAAAVGMIATTATVEAQAEELELIEKIARKLGEKQAEIEKEVEEIDLEAILLGENINLNETRETPEPTPIEQNPQTVPLVPENREPVEQTPVEESTTENERRTERTTVIEIESAEETLIGEEVVESVVEEGFSIAEEELSSVEEEEKIPDLLSPILNINNVIVDEDDSIPVSYGKGGENAYGFEIFNPNPNSNLRIEIHGLPEGATLTAGEFKDDVWHLNEEQTKGLKVVFDEHISDDFEIEVVAQVSDNYGQTAIVKDSQTFTINADADVPTLDLTQQTSGNKTIEIKEDETTVFDIASELVDKDGSESLYFDIEGLPENAELSSGERGDDGIWRLQLEDLEGLLLTPAEHDSDDFTLTVKAYSKEAENGDIAVTSDSINVVVEAVANQYGLDLTQGGGSNKLDVEEDQQIALNIATEFIDDDGSESVHFDLEGIPPNAVLSAGEKQEDGTWRLGLKDLEGLMLTPAAYDDEDFTVTVKSYTVEAENGDATMTSATLDVNVRAVANPATLDLTQSITGDKTVEIKEDESVALDIASQFVDRDGSESMYFDVVGLSDKAKLSAGTKQEDGSWRLQPEDLENLRFTPAEYESDDFTLTVKSYTEEEENGDVAVTSDSIFVKIDAVANTPTLDLTQERSGNKTIAIDEDITIAFDIGSKLIDNDGSEFLYFDVIGLPGGAKLSNGWRDDIGVWHLRAEDIEGLKLTPEPHSDKNFTIKVKTYAQEKENGDIAFTEDTLSVSVNAVADKAILNLTQNLSGNNTTKVDEDTKVALDISTALVDTDGSETLYLDLEGIPLNATLNNGWRDGAGVWHLRPNELEGLELTPGEDDGDDFNINVKSYTKEASNGSIAVSSGVVAVTVNAVADTPTLDVTQELQGDKTIAISEDIVVALDIQAGLTDIDGSEILRVQLVGLQDGATLSSGIKTEDGSWWLKPEELEDLQLTPGEHDSDDFTITVNSIAFEEENGSIAVVTDTVDVAVTAVADTPILDLTQDSSGDNTIVIDEDETVALDINSQLVDIDGSESMYVDIEGVPANATLSAGEKQDNGTWRLISEDLENLTLTPAIHDDSDFELAIKVYATEESNGEVAMSSGVVAVTVNAVADAPTLDVTQDLQGDKTVVIDEDATVALDIKTDLIDTDGSETLLVQLVGIPDGVALSNGAKISDGSWWLKQEDLENLTLTPKYNDDSDFTITVNSITYEEENDSFSTTTDTIDVTVNAVTDSPIINSDPISATEDVAFTLSHLSTLIDTDGSETAVYELSNIPDVVTLDRGSKDENGVWHLSHEELESVKVATPKDSDSDFSFGLKVTVTEAENGDEVVIEKNVNVNVGAVADAPTLSVTNARGDEDTSIPLNIQAAVTDTDGSETVYVKLIGIPDGAVLNKGTRISDGSWWLKPGEINGATLTPKLHDASNFTITVKAISQESRGGDTETTSKTLSVSIKPVVDIPVINVSDISGGKGVPIYFNLASAPRDSDGSEIIERIEILGVPLNYTLSAGSRHGDMWFLTKEQLSGLTISSPLGIENTIIPLTVKSYAKERETGKLAVNQKSFNLEITGEIHGTNSPDSLIGDDWENQIYGYGGNDTLEGRGGADTYYGGAGNDTIIVDGEDYTFGFISSSIVQGGSGTDTLQINSSSGGTVIMDGMSVENVIGGSGADIFVGSSASETFTGSGGADIYKTGGGNDTIYIDNSDITAGDSSFIDGGSGTDTVRADSVTKNIFMNMSSSNIENFYGGSGTNTAVFSENASSYSISNFNRSSYSLTVNGTQSLHNVQKLQFADRTIDLTTNYAPIANDDRELFTATEDRTLVINPSTLLANDSDIESDFLGTGSLSVVGVSNLSNGNGTVTLKNGQIHFTPNSNFNTSRLPNDQGGTDDYARFQYTIQDSEGATSTATAEFKVNAVADGAKVVSITTSNVYLLGNSPSVDVYLKFEDVDSKINDTSSLTATTDPLYVEGKTFTPGLDITRLGSSNNIAEYKVVYRGVFFHEGYTQANEDIFALEKFHVIFTTRNNSIVRLNNLGISLYKIDEDLYDPLILDLDGNGLETLFQGEEVYTDIDFDDVFIKTNWVAPDDGILLWDRDKDGEFSSLEEIAWVELDENAANDFEAMHTLFDENRDLVFDERDSYWSEFLVWQDRNSDGESSEDEMMSLEEAGIASINLEHTKVENSLEILALGTYTDTDGNQQEAAAIMISGVDEITQELNNQADILIEQVAYESVQPTETPIIEENQQEIYEEEIENII